MLFYLNQYTDLECSRESLAVAPLAHLCRDISRLGMPRAKLPSIQHLEISQSSSNPNQSQFWWDPGGLWDKQSCAAGLAQEPSDRVSRGCWLSARSAGPRSVLNSVLG